MENPTVTNRDGELDRITMQRSKLKSRHAHKLSALMSEREDLRGVNDLADIAFESLRWSA